MKEKKLKKEKKNNFYLKYKKTNKHIYIYIYNNDNIILSCSSNEKIIKKNINKKNYYSIELIYKLLIIKLINKNIYKLKTTKKKYNGKYKFLINYLKKKKFI
ncbi:hypothetical protein [Candidatus Vidania fulgoroideorum]